MQLLFSLFGDGVGRGAGFATLDAPHQLFPDRTWQHAPADHCSECDFLIIQLRWE